MTLPRGILYQLTARPGAELLATSLWSLRQHYNGPVAIATTPECADIAGRFADEPRLRAIIVPMRPVPEVKRVDHFNKVVTYLLTPFERTIYLDADTVIQGSFDKLFEANCGVALTQVANMWLSGAEHFPSHTRERMQVFRKISQVFDDRVDAVLKMDCPAINCGMVLYDKGHPFLDRVHDVALTVRTERMNDEIVIMFLMPIYHNAVEILCDKWNRCVRYALDGDITNSVMLHFHRKSWHRGCPRRDLWLTARDAAIAENFCGLADWCGEYNDEALD